MGNLRIALRLSTGIATLWLWGCAASPPERVVPEQGFRVDVGAICSAIDQSQDGKVDKQEFCNYFKDKDLAEQTFNSLDEKQQGYITREDMEKRQENLDHVIRLTGPRGR